MAKIVDTKEYLDMVRQLLAEGKTDVPVPVAGSSMVPFLINADTVYLNRIEKPLRRGDVVLYTRLSGQYVLHRIVKVNSDGSFIMLGDAQQELERIESRDQIHARATRAVHKGKPMTQSSFRWRFYATVWIWVWPFRRRLMSVFGKKKTR
jgi:hypothetical protein